MSSASSKTYNVEESAQESFRALIHAIAPETRNPEGKVAVDKLAERLNEILGPEANEGSEHIRNERGELVNEEGLPVVEITEPVGDDDDPNYGRSFPPPVTVEPLLPLYQLPTSVQDQLRAQRNRILDLLEEEEAQAEEVAKKAATREREELVQKRAEETEKDHDRKKANRELQKKMGRALIQNLNKARAKDDEEQEAQRLRDEEASKQRKSPLAKKKTVAFVDSVDDAERAKADTIEALDWGDVTPARLETSKRPTLRSPSLLDRQPMKMQVVERTPRQLPQTTLASRLLGERVPDSDDEDEEDEHVDDSYSADSSEGDEDLDEDEVDLDFAAQQREIEMEYHKKRSVIGQAASAAMMNHSHLPDEDSQSGSSHPAMSQYRASRVATAYNATLPSKSNGSDARSFADTVVPVGATRTIQRAVRTGKLDDDERLVGAEDDSASEVEEGIQEVIELLRKGEVYNIGPDGNHLHFVPPTSSSTSAGPTTELHSLDSHPNTPSPLREAAAAVTLPPPSMRTKPSSKFKVSRAAAGRPVGPSQALSNLAFAASTQSDSSQPSPSTPISNAARSSPKSTSPLPMATKGVVLERKAPTRAPPGIASVVATSSIDATAPQPSAPVLTPQNSRLKTNPMIIDSPSFPNTPTNLSSGSSLTPPTSLPTAVDSPSFPSMIVESPSFPRPQGLNRANIRPSPMPPTVIPSASSTRESRRPSRPPQVLASRVVESTVRERGAARPSAQEAQEAPEPKRISRFAAERL